MNDEGQGEETKEAAKEETNVISLDQMMDVMEEDQTCRAFIQIPFVHININYFRSCENIWCRVDKKYGGLPKQASL